MFFADRRRMITILRMAEAVLSEQDYRHVKELYDNRESKLALEVLCEQLNENDTHISKEAYTAILDAAHSVTLDSKYTDMVKHLVNE